MSMISHPVRVSVTYSIPVSGVVRGTQSLAETLSPPPKKPDMTPSLAEIHPHPSGPRHKPEPAWKLEQHRRVPGKSKRR